jgi:tRNA-specific 2-thiouridylase
VGSPVLVRVRHRAKLALGELIRIDGTEIEIALDEAVSAITPGQSVVLYDGTKVVGGGFIERAAHERLTAENQRHSLPILAA